jgi:hypothetical protein
MANLWQWRKNSQKLTAIGNFELAILMNSRGFVDEFRSYEFASDHRCKTQCRSDGVPLVQQHFIKIKILIKNLGKC